MNHVLPMSALIGSILDNDHVACLKQHVGPGTCTCISRHVWSLAIVHFVTYVLQKENLYTSRCSSSRSMALKTRRKVWTCTSLLTASQA